MSRLYHELADEYHLMYQGIFDYQTEFETHKEIFARFCCSRILELGCGTGNLAESFAVAGYSYTGSDVSREMIDIARRLHPGADFVVSDMRSLAELSEPNGKAPFDAAFCCGRSFTYMTGNNDVLACLRAVNRTLKEGGLFVVDNFLAPAIFGDFPKHLENRMELEGMTITRISDNSPNLETGWTWNWNATYLIEKADGETRKVADPSVLRAFLPEELSLFLSLSGFDTMENELDRFSFRTTARKRASAKEPA
jgi:SAM-dependent methyltransferase